MRVFTAIEIPPEIKTALLETQRDFKKLDIDVKWVEPQNIHLTLKFLGEINQGQSESIITVLDGIVQNKNTYKIGLGEVGIFPNISSPRIIWIGLEDGIGETKQIFLETEAGLKELGFGKEERIFSPHITLGRIRSFKNKHLLKEMVSCKNNRLKESPLEFFAGGITLFSSTLTPKGPIYEPIKKFTLRNN